MGRYDPMVPGEVRDTSNKEYELLTTLYALDAKLMSGNELLHNRCNAVPNGWRDLKMIVKRTRNLLKELVETLPEKRQRTLFAMADHSHIYIKADKEEILQHFDNVRAVNVSDINTIANYAFQHECAMCLREGKEINRCPLRAALIGVEPPRVTCAYGCEYRMMYEALIDAIEKEESA